MVLGGDFRQILPVIPRGSHSDIVHATINSSYLWDNYQVLILSKNIWNQEIRMKLPNLHSGFWTLEMRLSGIQMMFMPQLKSHNTY